MIIDKARLYDIIELQRKKGKIREDFERGNLMKKDKRTHKLSLQLITMTVILFIIGTAVGAVILFNGSRDMYLRAKDDMISYDLNDLGRKINENVCINWLLRYCLNHSDYLSYSTEEEEQIVEDYFEKHGLYGADVKTREEALNNLDPSLWTAFAKREYLILGNCLNSTLLDSDYEKLYCIDISEENCGFVYCDTARTDYINDAMFLGTRSGMKWDYSEDDHPAIENLRSGSREIQFEVASIEPDKDATSYIGYLPIGNGDAAICISYDWTSFRDQLLSKVRTLVLVLLGAMLLTCVLIMLFLRKVVIKPLSSVQLTLKDYMNNKDSEAAQEHLKNIKTKNEIGVLSDDVTALVREIDKYTEHIKKLSVEVMEALAHTIDAKDRYTNGHSFRVAMYSRMLAKELGLSSQEQEDIYYMGLLHDIGKIGIPGAIINKTSRLTDEEYETIKMHPVYGYEILSEIKSMPELSIGARYHHERIDGRGYPDGLKGEDIPFMARIISVADSYDTMTSNRSYRDYLPQNVVREEIEKNIGTQFDEAPARAMLKIMDRDKEYMLHE